MNVLIIDNGTKHINELVDCFSGHEIKVLKYRKQSRVDLEWADMYVLSGGNKPVIFKSYFSNELRLIRETHKPLIGICLGFELIADAFGSKLNRQATKTVGLKDVEISSEFFGLEDKTTYKVYEAHRWVLTDPKQLESIGSSNRGSEIIKHTTRPIVGLQFHPEVTEPENDGKLLSSIIVRMLSERKI